MPYKLVKFLGIEFRIAAKGNWIKFSDKEIQDLLAVFKITKDELLKSHQIDQIKESKETVKETKIPALNKVEILGYSAQINGLITKMKSVKDISNLRKEFSQIAKTNKEMKDLLDENNDFERSQILDEFKIVKTKEIESNQPVFSTKRILKFILENKTTNKSELKNWIIKKEK